MVRYQPKKENIEKLSEFLNRHKPVDEDIYINEGRLVYEPNKDTVVERGEADNNTFYKEKMKIRLVVLDYCKLYNCDFAESWSFARKFYLESDINRINDWSRRKRKGDSLFLLKNRMRTNIRNSLKKNGFAKRNSTERILGMKIDNLIKILDFKKELEIDHIIPLSWAKTEKEIYALNHYSNLQMLSRFENAQKKNYYCKKENLKKVIENHNNLKIILPLIERNKDKLI